MDYSDRPLAISVLEHWPEVSHSTPPEEMVAHAGNGNRMRESFVRRGLARSLSRVDHLIMR